MHGLHSDLWVIDGFNTCRSGLCGGGVLGAYSIYRHSALLFIGGVNSCRSGLCGGGVIGAYTEVFLAYIMIPEGLGFDSNGREWRERVLYKYAVCCCVELSCVSVVCERVGVEG